MTGWATVAADCLVAIRVTFPKLRWAHTTPLLKTHCFGAPGWLIGRVCNPGSWGHEFESPYTGCRDYLNK